MILQYIIKYSSKSSDTNIAPAIHSLVKLGLNSCTSGIINAFLFKNTVVLWNYRIIRYVSVVLSKGIEVSNWCKLIQNPIPVDYTTAMSEYKTLPTFSTSGSSLVILKLLASYGEYLSNFTNTSEFQLSFFIN